MTQKKFISEFMNELFKLSERFKNRASIIPLPEELEFTKENKSMLDDIFSPEGRRTNYEIWSIHSRMNRIDFVTATIDALPPLCKVNFLTTKKHLEELMYLPEFRLENGQWKYFQPIDIEAAMESGEQSIEIPLKLINDTYIDNILRKVFDGIEGTLTTF